MKIKALIFFCILILAVMTGCGKDTASTNTDSEIFCKINDDSGREIALSQKPQRIVVTSASFLEPLYAAGGEVVGRPISKNKSFEPAKNAADIGTVYQIDSEKLLACQPDLVIINKGMNEKLSNILEENKIPFFVVDMKSYDSVKKNIQTFAAITGQPEKGKKIIDDMDAKIKNITDKLPKETKRVAILHSTAQGLSVQLEGSIAGNVTKILGWENVAAGMDSISGKSDTAPYSLETLIEQNPEIIFVTSMGNIDEIKENINATIAENSAWQTIPAIKNGKLFFLPQDLFLLSPGIHYPDAVEFAAKLIYPELEF